MDRQIPKKQYQVMKVKEIGNEKYHTKTTELLRIQLETQSTEHDKRNPACHVGTAYGYKDKHKNVQGGILVRETLAYKQMESLEQILNINTTIGGHPLVTAQNEYWKYITRDSQIGERYKYKT